MNPQQRPQMYKFYATLLDSFQYFLSSDSDTATEELLDKINRVPFESEAADRGTAFNELVDLFLHDDRLRSIQYPVTELIEHKFQNRQGKIYDFTFPYSIIKQFTDRLEGYYSQLRTESILKTSKGDVLLYGVIDEIGQDDVTDIKTSGRYEFPKFLHAWQHRVYPYCLNQNGIKVDRFTYRITDFSNYYEEVYPYNHERATAELVSICERFIDFVEMNRNKISDKKIFGLD